MKKIIDIKNKYGKIFDLREIDILLAEALRKNIAFIAAHPEYEMRFFAWRRTRKFFKLLEKNLPIAYITGHKEFFGLDFLVNCYTLIPRPETELMVESVLDVIARSAEGATRQSPAILIDIGTGTGCVPISIGKILKYYNIKLFAADISRGALRVAKKNARRHGIKINFLRGDLLEPIIKKINRQHHPSCPCDGEFIITANLPYLTPEQFSAEPSIQYEPKPPLWAERMDWNYMKNYCGK